MTGRLARVVAAGGLAAVATIVFATPAFAAPKLPPIKIVTPVGNIGVPSVNCRPPPPVRDSAVGNSGAQFDGTPVDPSGPSIYDQYGSHPFNWAIYDPGCAGDVAQPIATTDTNLGDWELGLAQDIVAFNNGLYNVIAHPTWLNTFDRFETNAARATGSIFFFVLGALLVLIGLLIAARAHKGNMNGALRTVGWALFVVTLVTWVVANPVRILNGVAHFETTTISSIESALSGQSDTTTNPIANMEIQSVIYPQWLGGEVGSATSTTALRYGPSLLDGQTYRWAELQNGTPISTSTAGDKNGEFKAAASAIKTADPPAYHQLTGQAGGRLGAGFFALLGVVATIPFMVFAAVLVAASLLLLMLEMVLLPLIAVVAIFEPFRHALLKGVLTVTFAAVCNAILFSAAAAVNVLIVGFLLGGASGLPTWLGAFLSFVVAVVLFFALRKFRLTRLVRPNDLQVALHSVSDQYHKITHKAAQAAATVGSGAVGGPVGLAVKTGAAATAVRESLGDSDRPDVEPWVNDVRAAPDQRPGGDEPVGPEVRAPQEPAAPQPDWTGEDLDRISDGGLGQKPQPEPFDYTTEEEEVPV